MKDGKNNKMKNKKEYIIIPGLDLYWYVIPKDKEEDWNDWCEVTAEKHNFLEEAYKGKHPNYSKKIKGNISSVIFKEFRIKK